MYGYIYKSYCKVTNKYYIGSRKSDKFINTYFGSGKYIKEDIKKYGKENFTVEIIKECSSVEDLKQSELYYIKYYNAVESNKFYNASYLTLRLDELDNLDKIKLKMSIKKKGKATWNKGKHDVYTKETLKKMSNSRKRIGNLQNGLKRTNKSKEKMRKAKEGRVWITNGIINKFIIPDSLKDYPEFILGYTKSENQKHTNRMSVEERKQKFGRHVVYFTDGIINKRVLPEDIEKFITENPTFKRGRIVNKRKENK